MLNKKEEKTIKVRPETHKKLKVAAAKRGKTLVAHVEDCGNLSVNAFNK